MARGTPGTQRQALKLLSGERHGFQLPDGTCFRLHTDSAATLEVTAWQRLIKLARGEITVTCGSSLTPPPSQPLRPAAAS